MTGWWPLVRLAWRDLARHKGRSLVVLLMITLPVLGVTTASTLIATAEVDPAQSMSRAWGPADVQVSVGQTRGTEPDGPGVVDVIDTLQGTVRAALGDGVETSQRIEGAIRVATDDGAARVEAVETDLRSPLAKGTYRLVEGRLPKSTGEVVVNRYLADAGPGMGENLAVRDGNTLRVVGIVEDGYSRSGTRAWSLPGSLIDDPKAPGAVHDLYVFAGVPAGSVVTDDVLSGLRNDGYEATTRGEDMWSDGMYLSGSDVAVFVLVAVMALTEVVLLAGPAFAVSARRRSRELALVAANGGTPRQVRSAVLASALVIGVIGAVAGSGLGIFGAWAATPLAQRFVDEWFGAFEVVWWQVAGIAAFGLVSAALAAVVPAWIASRLDVVRVLSGRRGDPAPARFSPLLGIGLAALGLVLTAVGVAGATGTGEIWIGFGAVSTVLGAVALMPLILRILAGLLGGAPLVVRYALRDGLRHRTRTVPAIGAVMATVAGVVALSIANSSDQASGEKAYQPQGRMGEGIVYLYSDMLAGPDGGERVREDVIAAVRGVAPDAAVVRGLSDAGSVNGTYQDLRIQVGEEDYYGPSSGPFNLGIQVVSRASDMADRLSASDKREAARVLAAGGVVLLNPDGSDAGDATLTLRIGDQDDPEEAEPAGRVTVPAVVITTDAPPMASVVVPDTVARDLGLDVVESAVLIQRQVSTTDEKELVAVVTDVTDSAYVYVERGWQPDSAYAIVMLILTVIGALLMVGGTLTATVLALADAGPDLAALSAVGAAPRTSRAVAMATAFVIGGVGAALGALVGAVPGIAATWPMTNHDWAPDGGNIHTIDIPWLLIATIVIAVPVLLALVVGLCARSRLPLVARVD